MVLSFPTVASYQAAKAQGGAIYNAVLGGGRYTASVASYIAEIGRSVIDALNLVVPRSQGQPGDVLLYRTADAQYFWLKVRNPSASWSAALLGQTVYDQAKLASAGYVEVGFMLYRRNRSCAVLSLADIGSAAWASASGLVPNVATGTLIDIGTGTQAASAAFDLATAEQGSINDVTLPVSRSVWENVIASTVSGASASGSFTNGSWTTTGGVASITYLLHDTSFTINPADYAFDFDEWWKLCVRAKRDASSGIASLAQAQQNTGALVAAGGKPAASACRNYGLSGVPAFVAGRWHQPSVSDFVAAMPSLSLLRDKGVLPSSRLWTSDQADDTLAWAVDFSNGRILTETKTTSRPVRAIAHIEI